MRHLTFIFTISAMLFVGANLQAQTSFGVRAGVNLASVVIESQGLEISPDNKIGLTFGALAEIGMSESFSIQPEVYYTQKGYKQSSEFGGSTSEDKFAMNYLEIPIHAKYKFGIGSLGGFVMAGPSIGYALSGSTESCFDGECETVDVEFDDDDGFNRTEIGLSVGGGINLSSGLFVDLRFVVGLSNLIDDETIDDITFKNRGLQVGLGYMFGGSGSSK